MFPHRALPHPVLAVGTLAMTVALLSGCSPTPQPTSTPTAVFASEEEAFQAAEQTYRAYNDALNSERTGDPSISRFDFLTGMALDAELAADRELKAGGIQLKGQTRILTFQKVRADFEGPATKVEAHVCLDISAARAISSSGEDVTASGRSNVYAVRVVLVGSSDALSISELQLDTDIQC